LQKELFEWQNECLDIWFRSGCRGIVNAVTGGGKTVLALNAAKRLESSLREQGHKLKIRIIVPKTFLVSQWRAAILEETDARRGDIGCYFGSHKDDPSLRYMIYVLNSARFSLSRHILADIQKGFHVLLIVDECHHCSGEINAKIFDFVPRLAESAFRYHSLGLSATAEKIAQDSRFSTALGNVIYRYELPRALREGVVSDFMLFQAGVSFLPEERGEYEDLSVSLAKAITSVRKLCPALRRLGGAAFFARLEKLSAEGGKAGAAAAQVMLLSYRRKEIMHLAENRIACACGIVRLLPAHSKILLFGERIECAQQIYARLCGMFPGQAAMYHSGMSRESAKNALSRYQDGEVRILVGCRALDEGLNVPETDVGIVVSSSRAALQRVQRLGRILRRKQSGLPAKLYYLYLENTGEEAAYLENCSGDGFPVIPLIYDGETDRFLCAEFGPLAERVLAYGGDKKIAPAEKAELLKNMELCLLRGDFCLAEELCVRERENAEDQPERNYWTAALLLARARLDRL